MCIVFVFATNGRTMEQPLLGIGGNNKPLLLRRKGLIMGVSRATVVCTVAIQVT